MKKFINPAHEIISNINVYKYYLNVFQEFDENFLSEEEKEYICDIKRNASERILLDNNKTSYFKYAYSDNFTIISKFLLSGAPNPTILDLGCGIGTQSIFVALKGANVIAVDIDIKALNIFRKRIHFYENIFSQKLNITIIEENALNIDFSSFKKIDGIFSMFAFNIMQPSKRLMQNLYLNMNKDCKIGIIDGNNQCWISRIFPSMKRAVWSPFEFKTELQDHNFRIERLEGAFSLIHICWKFKVFNQFISFIDKIMSQSNWLFPRSYILLAVRFIKSNEKS